jgi:hypothetical protein
VGDNFAPWGQSLPCEAKLRMVLWLLSFMTSNVRTFESAKLCQINNNKNVINLLNIGSIALKNCNHLSVFQLALIQNTASFIAKK